MCLETKNQIEQDADQEIQERIQFFKEQIDDRDNVRTMGCIPLPYR